MPEPIRVVITGAAGQTGYPLLYMVASGEVFGPKQPLILHLLDLPESSVKLDGIVMEVIDCAFSLIHQIIPTCDPCVAFKDVAAAFLVAGRPRMSGTETRKDLIKANVSIFKDQGRCLDTFALKDVKVLVVGNPCHTNALICALNAPSIPKENFTSISRLDLNRTYAQVASRLDMPVSSLWNIIVWGNHSPCVYPDVMHAMCQVGRYKKRLTDVLNDDAFAREELIEIVGHRGNAILEARKGSSAISAAKAACDHMRDWWHGTQPGHLTCMGVMSDGSYGSAKDVVFSFPVEIRNRKWTIVKNLKFDDFARQKIEACNRELMHEKVDAFAEIFKDEYRDY